MIIGGHPVFWFQCDTNNYFARVDEQKTTALSIEVRYLECCLCFHNVVVG